MGNIEIANQCNGNRSKLFLVLIGITFMAFLVVQRDLMRDVYLMYITNGSLLNNSLWVKTGEKASVLLSVHYRKTGTGYNQSKVLETTNQSIPNISHAGSLDIDTRKSRSYMNSDFGLDDIRNKWREGKALAVFLMSAISHNQTNTLGYLYEIKLNGWHGAKHRLTAIKCCIRLANGSRTTYLNPNETTRGKRLNLVATQLTCPIKCPVMDVVGVTVEFANKKCPTQNSDYIVPFITKRQPKPHSFAVCLKILYGNIDNKLLIDWLEFYKEMKVDKVFTFVYNITEDTSKIIKFYERSGFLEKRKFAFPWKKGRNVGMKTPVVWEDEQVVVYDCFYRLYGYNYIAIIDLDEFLLPRKHDNIKDAMENLMKIYPNAAGFSLKSFIFNKDWGVSGRKNGSDVVKYIQRTSALASIRARPKNILIPTRVAVDRVFNTHMFSPKTGYKRFTVNETTMALNHYRACYNNLRTSCNKRKSITDIALLKVIDNIHNRTILIT